MLELVLNIKTLLTEGGCLSVNCYYKKACVLQLKISVGDIVASLISTMGSIGWGDGPG